MRTANIRNAQELKSVNAKESAALAKAFVSKEFLEIQVEKGNIDDVQNQHANAMHQSQFGF